jgi:hypothetical protein
MLSQHFPALKNFHLVHNELLTISAQELGILHFKRKKLGQLDV